MHCFHQFIAFVVLTVHVPLASALVVYSGFGEGDSYDYFNSRSATTPDRGNPAADGDVAQAFTVSVGEDVRLDAIDLAVRLVSGANKLDVWLMGNRPSVGQSHGEPDGNIIEAFRVDGGLTYATVGSIVSVNSVVRPTLFSGEEYWLVLSVPEPNSQVAFLSAATELSPRSVWIAERFDFNAYQWEVAFSEAGPGYAFRIEASPVPVPAPIVLLAAGAACLVAFGRRKTRHE
jgi:hypothetical protein